ncbi:MAG: hypothetical protein RLZZ490_2006 [Cyanobacteriota bacterium]|jgi:hypothetical protein
MKFIGFKPLLLAIAVSALCANPINAESPLPLVSPPQEVAQTETAFDEKQILALMDQIKQAEKAEDVETLMSFLAPFVVSEVTVQTGNQSITRTIEGLSAHRAMLKASYDQREANEVLNENINVRFDDDGHIAVVTRYNLETTELSDNRKLVSMAKDVIRFALVNGQPKVISVMVDGWSEERP